MYNTLITAMKNCLKYYPFHDLISMLTLNYALPLYSMPTIISGAFNSACTISHFYIYITNSLA